MLPQERIDGRRGWAVSLASASGGSASCSRFLLRLGSPRDAAGPGAVPIRGALGRGSRSGRGAASLGGLAGGRPGRTHRRVVVPGRCGMGAVGLYLLRALGPSGHKPPELLGHLREPHVDRALVAKSVQSVPHRAEGGPTGIEPGKPGGHHPRLHRHPMTDAATQVGQIAQHRIGRHPVDHVNQAAPERCCRSLTAEPHSPPASAA